MDFDASELKATIAAIKANVQNAKKAAAMYVLGYAQHEITSGGSGWAPMKRLPKRPHALLWDSATLLRSLTPGDSENILQIGDPTTIVGSAVAYAAALNYGYPEHNLPARPYLITNDEVSEGAAQAFIKTLLQGVI